jgi:hypothetical protein
MTHGRIKALTTFFYSFGAAGEASAQNAFYRGRGKEALFY